MEITMYGAVVREAELPPDSVLPSQFNDRLFGGARVQPEKRLQLATLADAVATFRRSVGVDRRRARHRLAEVDAWFASDAADGPFTFVAICDSLNIDAAYIRDGLERWRRGREAAAPRESPDGHATWQVAVAPLRRIA
jgi:hypothetical protein